MSHPVCYSLFASTRFGQFDGFLCDFVLQQLTAPRKIFNRMAISIASGEIHFPVNSGRVEAQSLLDPAQGLDKLAPVQSAQEPQTVNGMTDGNLVGGLVLALQMDQLLHEKPLVGET